VFGNTVLVPAGGPKTSSSGGGGNPQLVASTVPLRTCREFTRAAALAGCEWVTGGQ
jgi:hypothetical protein